MDLNHFRRRRVRRRKYCSRSGVSNRPPPADDRGAERSAMLFVEEGKAFFDKLEAATAVAAFLSVQALLELPDELAAVQEERREQGGEAQGHERDRSGQVKRQQAQCGG